MANPGDEFPAGEDYIVRRIKDLERKVDQNASSIPRSFQTTVDSLNATIATLNGQVVALTAQGVTLNAQVARIDGQVTQISALVNAQVVPVVGNGSAAGFTLTTSYATLVSFGLTVPAGYTRALVSVSVFASSTTATTGPSDRIYVQAVTDGVAGPESISVMSPGLPSAAAAAFQARTLSGLTAGAAISISVQARLAVGPAVSLYTNATASAIAIFQT